jgi:phage tail-like protein
MAVLREQRPYVQFNFQVDLLTDGMDPTGFTGGFQEISGIGMEVTVSEYRCGTDKYNGVRKITGLNKVADVTLKNGLIGSLALYSWLDLIRSGDQTQIRQQAIIRLMSEDHSTTVLTWKLLGARIIKMTHGPLNAKGTDVAMQEVVINYERLEME